MFLHLHSFIFTEKQKVISTLDVEAGRIIQEYSEKRKLLVQKKEDAEKEAPIIDEDGNDTPLKAQLEALEVSDLTEVDAAIEEAERVLQNYHANPEVIRHYEKLKSEIEQIEADLAVQTSTHEKGQTLLTQQRKDWESRLEEFIFKTNALFTTYMAEMGCTGEVCLTKGLSFENGDEKKDNFKQWGLQIRVSFREGCKAEVLSAQRHSGGERSVSTIMYLMALQNLMIAPFRCVDEINQGLDDRNERLVFSRIVANSCNAPKKSLTDHSGQYFLITPKLLPNLVAMENEAITVLFVFNGTYNFKTSREWSTALHGLSSIEIEPDDENGDENGNNKSKKLRRS